MDPRYVDVQNFGFGIDDEFDPFENEENPTPTPTSASNPVLSSNLPPIDPQSKKPRMSKRTSIVWNHFTIVNRNNIRGELENMAECKYCKKIYSCKASGGTGHLKRHAEQCTKKHGALDPTQSQLNTSEIGSTSSHLSTFKYDQKALRDGLAGIVASMKLPMTFGEDPRFVHFMTNYAQPAYQRIPRTTSRNDVIRNYKNTKNLVIQELNSHSGIIAVTSDIWTNQTNIPFTCVTAHYTDSDWKLNKKIIGFRIIYHPHDAPSIYDSMISVFREYNIQNKIFSITFDNASNNTSAIDLFVTTIRGGPLSEIFHVRCVCHIINLIVQDGLKLISPSLDAIRETLSFIQSSRKLQDFYALCKSMGLKKRKFYRDVHHRWNSTYLMLKSCVGYDNVLSDYVNSKLGVIKITSSDWEKGFAFLKFLKVFYDSTNLCSAVYTPTSCIALRCICNMSAMFNQYREYPFFTEICLKMEKKFLKYWKNVPMLFCLASCMDPRVKVEGVENILSFIANCMNQPYQQENKIYEQLNTLYKYYETKYGSVSGSSSDTTLCTFGNDEFYMQLAKGKRQVGPSSRCDLSKYLDTDYSSYLSPDEIQNFDIMKWWKSHEFTFPVLSKMARDLLTPPVSTVASESAFSIAANMIGNRRANISPEMLEALTCLKDWEDGRMGLQNWVDDFKDQFESLDINQNQDVQDIDEDDEDEE